LFVAAVRPWRTFQRHWVELYAGRAGLPLVAAIDLAAGVMVPGEELFWRGLFQAKMSVVLDGRTAGAAVGRGALASIVCHAIWTALILGFPVVRIPVGGRA